MYAHAHTAHRHTHRHAHTHFTQTQTHTHTCKLGVFLIFYPWRSCEQGLTALPHMAPEYSTTPLSSMPERDSVHH